MPETASDFSFNQYDYVVDAVDTMSAKLALVTHCHAAGVPIICAMGAGNKLDPTGFQVADLAKTKMDPLAARQCGLCALRGGSDPSRRSNQGSD